MTRLVRWQFLTLSLIVTGYAGYYLCRSNYSVTMPMITADLAAQGMDADAAKIGLGRIASLGTLAYAIGKFLSGSLSDLGGGKRNFLLGMAGSVFFSVLFAMGGGMPIFTLAWCGNRLMQSLGWVSMVRIASRWFSYSVYGSVMAIVSLSFLFGDAIGRAFMSALIGYGLEWRTIFFVAAGALAGLLIVNLFLLKETPRALGEPEPPANPLNLFGDAGNKARKAPLGLVLGTLMSSPVFWLVCLLSLGLTLVRETFGTWTPMYFKESLGLTSARAAQLSALFPLLGGVSVILAGFASDRLGRGGRALIMLIGLLLAGAALLVLGLASFGNSIAAQVALVALVAFLVIGPYSYLAGAVALDFGGRQGSATAAGFIDGVGYLGGFLAGESMARISVLYGWSGAFAVLAGVAWLSCVAAIFFWLHERGLSRRNANPGAESAPS